MIVEDDLHICVCINRQFNFNIEIDDWISSSICLSWRINFKFIYECDFDFVQSEKEKHELDRLMRKSKTQYLRRSACGCICYPLLSGDPYGICALALPLYANRNI